MNRRHKILLSLAVMLMAVPLQLAAANMKGDVNNDSEVDIADVTLLINYLLYSDNAIDTFNADTDLDGKVDIADVTLLINHLLTGEELPSGEVGADEDFTVNGVSFVMTYVEGGTFLMGATEEQGNDASDRERPVHQVTVSSFHIGQTEVTQALWMAVMGESPSYFTGEQRPVESVSWDECQQFIATLNSLTGREFRLPTEAEWEFAARGGNESMGCKYSGSNNLASVGWYSYNDAWEWRGTGSHGTHNVATRMPNELFLFDMSGNVHEWCNDWYANYDYASQTDPTGPASGTNKVYRGGCWYFDEWFCRVSFRNSVTPSYHSYGIGFRLAL